MEKPRRKIVNKPTNKLLTKQLNISELDVINTDTYSIDVVCKDKTVPICPECRHNSENFGLFERTVLDVVDIDGKKQFARLHLYFYKYRCLNRKSENEDNDEEECGLIFQKGLKFVKDNAKTTRRYEDEIMRRVMYESIDKVRVDLKAYVVEDHKKDIISKPAIAKLVKRWVHDKDEARRYQNPSNIIIYTYDAFNHSYLTICEMDGSKLILLEVLPEISVSSIHRFIEEKLDKGGIWRVVIDCNPTVYDAVTQIFPPEKIIVDTDALKYVVEKEYDDFIYDRYKTYPKIVREFLRSDGVNLLPEDASKIYQMKQNDKKLDNAYSQYARLYRILDNHQDMLEIKSWSEDLSDDKDKVFESTLMYIASYWTEIVNYYKRRNEVSGSTYEKLYKLNQMIENYFPVCTDDAFRARMLYPRMEEIDSSTMWKGIPIDDLYELLKEMISEGGLKEHERKRRQD